MGGLSSKVVMVALIPWAIDSSYASVRRGIIQGCNVHSIHKEEVLCFSSV